MKKIVIIGAGMGGLAAGIYGQLNGFDTTIFEAHTLPGGQFTSWTRKGYVFDPCLHHLNGFKELTKVNKFWKALGALPCDTVSRNEYVSAVFPDGKYVHFNYDTDSLEANLLSLAPEDTVHVKKYIDGIKSFTTDFDWFGISNFGTIREKLFLLSFFLPRMKYFKHTMGSFGKKFTNPYLQKTIPLLRMSLPHVPLFAYLAEHVNTINGDMQWPKGGGLTISRNMADHYAKLGGTILYQRRVTKILTENKRACGVVLEDGTEHKADYVISNADGRKTINDLLENRYENTKVKRYCMPYPENDDICSAVIVFLGVKRDLKKLPSSLIVFLDEAESICGHQCDHLTLQIYGFDSTMAPSGKGVIKVELFCSPAYFSRFVNDKAAYRAEKERIADRIISLMEKQFPGLRNDIEVVDVSTLNTWERYMNGTQGFNNFPRKYPELTDIRNVLDFIFGLNKMFTLPGLKNFFFTGQWVTSMGSAFSNALTGKTVIQKICRENGTTFKP